MKMRVILTTMVLVFVTCFTATQAIAIDVPLAKVGVTPPAELRVMSVSQGSTFELRRAVTCRLRVHTTLTDGTCHYEYGSGTVFNKHKLASGKTVGLVATVAHIFPTGWSTEVCRRLRSNVIAIGANTTSRAAQLLLVDWDNDVSVWAVYVDDAQRVAPLAVHPAAGASCVVTGFGPDGVFRARSGPVKGYVSVGWDGATKKVVPASRTTTRYKSTGKNQVYLTRIPIYKGDSGGGILTTDNRLAGVLWGGGGTNVYGTYAGTLQSLLDSQLPETFSWGCSSSRSGGGLFGGGLFQRGGQSQGQSQCQPQCPPTQVQCQPQYGSSISVPAGSRVSVRARTPARPQPDLIVGPPPPASVDLPLPDTSHDEVLEAIGELKTAMNAVQATQAEHTASLTGLSAGQGQLSTGQDRLGVGQETLAGMAPVLQQGQAGMLSALDTLRTQVDEIATADREISIQVRSPKFISPSYVDVSVLWALQQGTGVDHIVLIANSSLDSWPRLKAEFEEAQKKFPAIILFDVASRGLQFKELPQLVVYPALPDEPPVIIKGSDSVSKKLQALSRGE